MLGFGFWGAIDFRQAGRFAEPLRLTQELTISALAAVALFAAGQPVFAIALAALSIVYHGLSMPPAPGCSPRLMPTGACCGREMNGRPPTAHVVRLTSTLDRPPKRGYRARERTVGNAPRDAPVPAQQQHAFHL